MPRVHFVGESLHEAQQGRWTRPIVVTQTGAGAVAALFGLTQGTTRILLNAKEAKQLRKDLKLILKELAGEV